MMLIEIIRREGYEESNNSVIVPALTYAVMNLSAFNEALCP